MPFIGDQATANAKIKKHVFTASGSQVDFTVASNASDELQVFLNGVLLKLTDDYTYTTSTVTLGSGATVSDIVEVHVYQSFSLVDAIKTTGDTMTGELEVPTVKLSSNVIKASDGTTAITTSGANTTLAGTANNIGTVTSGTYNSTIGGSATFPAGHVIGFVHDFSVGSNTITSRAVIYEKEITLKSASSHVFIQVKTQLNINSAQVGFFIYRKTSSGVGTSDTLIYDKNPQDSGGLYLSHANSANVYFVYNDSCVDTTSHSVDDEVFYGVAFEKAGGTTLAVPADTDGTDGSIAITLMEILPNA